MLWIVLSQGNDTLLKAADEAYAAGSYTQAIDGYNRYLEKVTSGSDASAARIKRGLAQMRQATDVTANWPAALEVAQRVLKEISQEADFRSTVQPDLTALLPKIAEGLANQARKQPQAELVQQAEETLALIEKYVDKTGRPETKLADIRNLLELTRRDLARSAQLEQALAAMTAAVSTGKANDAYPIQSALLRDYPDLRGNEKLQKMIAAVCQAEQEAVKFVAQPRAAETAAPATALLGALTLARHETHQAVPAAKGVVLGALAGGAAYGLDADTGCVLWRRPVGFADNGRSPSFPPTPLASGPGSDLLLVDAAQNEVLRLRAASGQVAWRFAVGERFDAYPVIAGSELLIVGRSGRLHRVELETGVSPGYIEFPQELRVGPAVDGEQKTVFQVAEHSNLYVVSLAEGRCTSAVNLGHEAGTILVPPVVVGPLLVLARGDGVQSSRLQVFRMAREAQGVALKAVQELPLKGRVNLTPLVSGRRVLVMTDKAEMTVLEAADNDPNKPLNVIAEGVTGSDEEAVHFPLLVEGQLFVGDSQLTKYDVLAQRGRLQPRWNANQRSITLQPLQRIGQAVFQVRRKQGMAGAVVAAIDGEEGRILWETHLAAPLVSEPWYEASSDTLTAVSASGGIFEVPASHLSHSGVLDEPALGIPMAEVRQAVSDAVRLDHQLWVLVQGKGAAEVSIFRPGERRPHQVPLPAPLGGPTAGLNGALVTPLEVGQVLLLDPFRGEKQAEPFQLSVQPGSRTAWQRPLVLGSGELLVTDGHRALHRLALQETPRPALSGQASAELATPLVSSLAVAGEAVFAVAADGKLVSFLLPQLQPGESCPLPGRCVWGPWSAGERVLLATAETLLAFDAQQKPLWQVPLASVAPVGAPLVEGGSLVLASANGTVWRVDPANGQALGKVEIGSPLSTGPVAVGPQLVVGGYDGSLYQIPKP